MQIETIAWKNKKTNLWLLLNERTSHTGHHLDASETDDLNKATLRPVLPFNFAEKRDYQPINVCLETTVKQVLPNGSLIGIDYAIGIELYYLQDQRAYSGNDLFWWQKTGGYATDLSSARVFTKDEAIKQHKCRPEVDIPWLKEYIDGKNRPTVDVQHLSREFILNTDRIEL